jgi:hypothetical protein
VVSEHATAALRALCCAALASHIFGKERFRIRTTQPASAALGAGGPRALRNAKGDVRNAMRCVRVRVARQLVPMRNANRGAAGGRLSERGRRVLAQQQRRRVEPIAEGLGPHLRRAWCMAHGACSVLCVTCCMVYVCRMLRGVRCALRVACCTCTLCCHVTWYAAVARQQVYVAPPRRRQTRTRPADRTGPSHAHAHAQARPDVTRLNEGRTAQGGRQHCTRHGTAHTMQK